MYDPEKIPGFAEIAAGQEHGAGYFVSHAPDTTEGWVELLCNGLTFDLHGLRDGPVALAPEIRSAVGLDIDQISGKRWLTLAPGPHLAGAGRLLPVIRVLSVLLIELSKLGQTGAVAWIPAHLAVKPEIFARAVQPWLEGGPFPGPAFVGFHRDERGNLLTEGLNFLMGQEFLLEGKGDLDRSELPRIAVRLVDWLVAHGPVVKPIQADLAGTGTVLLEVAEGGRIVARCV
ncbi:MAG: hypothetical protein ACO1OX_01475 [Novosphingobium sp.]